MTCPQKNCRRHAIKCWFAWLSFCTAIAPGCGKTEPTDEERLLQRQRQRQVAELAKPQSYDEKLATAEQELERGNFSSVQRITENLLLQRPDDSRVVLLAAQAIAGTGDKAAASELLESIPDTDVSIGSTALRQAAAWLAESGLYDKAIDRMERLRQSGNANQRDLHQLAMLLNNSGRRIEAAEVLSVVLKAGDITEKELFSLITLGSPFVDTSQPQPSVADPLTPAALAMAKVLREQDANEATTLARRLYQTHPQSPQIYAFAIRLAAETQDWEATIGMLSDRPADIELQPEYWFALGMLFQHREQHAVAVHCFLRSINLDATDRFSCLHLARSLSLLQRPELSGQMMRRYELLDESSRLIRKIGSAPGTDDQLNRLAEILDSLQRPLEAIEWRLIAARQHGSVDREISALKATREVILANDQTSRNQWSLPGFRIDDWPLPDFDSLGTTNAEKPKTKIATDSTMRFPNVAEQVGLNFQFVNRHPNSDLPFLIYHLSGGGIGVLDYDLDGWPDCYFTQAGGSPRDADGSLPNQFFRNLHGERFESVTDQTLTADRGFGQGVAVADLNQDGYPDVLIANFGRCVWFQNQGDGTFIQRVLVDGPDIDSWTTSIACGDLSGDGLPEVVLVNYSDDEDVFRFPCQVDGDYCSPLRFRAARDQILTVNDNGNVSIWEHGLPDDHPAGHGFGAIIANIDGNDGNELFIVNDTDSNHYWIAAGLKQA
ncbi:MAG: VCBS repeat-containing protein, partial [Planctomycetales bacterium]|nr:VCBS repeat-containing protein [Planctomycetales bacterium]